MIDHILPCVTSCLLSQLANHSVNACYFPFLFHSCALSGSSLGFLVCAIPEDDLLRDSIKLTPGRACWQWKWPQRGPPGPTLRRGQLVYWAHTREQRIMLCLKEGTPFYIQGYASLLIADSPVMCLWAWPASSQHLMVGIGLVEAVWAPEDTEHPKSQNLESFLLVLIRNFIFPESISAVLWHFFELWLFPEAVLPSCWQNRVLWQIEDTLERHKGEKQVIFLCRNFPYLVWFCGGKRKLSSSLMSRVTSQSLLQDFVWCTMIVFGL